MTWQEGRITTCHASRRGAMIVQKCQWCHSPTIATLLHSDAVFQRANSSAVDGARGGTIGASLHHLKLHGTHKASWERKTRSWCCCYHQACYLCKYRKEEGIAACISITLVAGTAGASGDVNCWGQKVGINAGLQGSCEFPLVLS